MVMPSLGMTQTGSLLQCCLICVIGELERDDLSYQSRESWLLTEFLDLVNSHTTGPLMEEEAGPYDEPYML